MNNERRSDPGFMLSTAWALVRETPWLASAGVALLAAIDTASDRLPQLSQLTSIPVLIASLAFQYGITFTLLERRGLAERGPRARFWALLGLS